MRRLPFFVALAVLALVVGAVGVFAASEYVEVVDDGANYSDPSNVVGAPDGLYMTISSGGWALLSFSALPVSGTGYVTVWWDEGVSCAFSPLDDEFNWFGTEYTSGSSPFTFEFTYTSTVYYVGVDDPQGGSCLIDAVMISDTPPATVTPTPTPTSTPTDFFFTATPYPTITPGVSGSQMNGFIWIFRGLGPLWALFFAGMLLSAILGLVSGRRRR